MKDQRDKMEHLAIMKKSWRLTDKILNGQKKIESRWYAAKCQPWDRIKKGETIYFKDSGEPVRIKAEVGEVKQYADLTPKLVKKIFNEYGEDIGIEKRDIPAFIERFKDKRYGLLVFIKNPHAIEPFEIDKAGFGLMAAWITVKSLAQIRK